MEDFFDLMYLCYYYELRGERIDKNVFNALNILHDGKLCYQEQFFIEIAIKLGFMKNKWQSSEIDLQDVKIDFDDVELNFEKWFLLKHIVCFNFNKLKKTERLIDGFESNLSILILASVYNGIKKEQKFKTEKGLNYWITIWLDIFKCKEQVKPAWIETAINHVKKLEHEK